MSEVFGPMSQETKTPLALSQIGQIALTAHDLDRAVAFYRDKLGMAFLFRVPNLAFFDCSGVRLMLSAPERAETFPAASVALAVMLCVPSLNALLVMLQLPLPSAVVVPSTVLPSSNTTALLASAVPEKVGVVTLVLLSVLELPLSLVAAMSGVVGAVLGGVLSMVMLSAAEADETLPAASVALAVMLCVPAVRVLVLMPGLL